MGVRLVSIDRSATDLSLEGADYFGALARRVDDLAQGGAVRLVGFSLGASVALRAAAHVEARVAGIDLISGAAPLESGDFLDAMAGKPVFQMAVRSPAGFRRLTAAQGWLARWAPGVLLGMLFRGAAAADRTLAGQPWFRSDLGRILQASLGAGAAGYRRDVEAYVRPWAAEVAHVGAEVRVWHGAADTWSPPGMVAGFAAVLPRPPETRILPGLSHYSCLFEAMPKILEAAGVRASP